MTTNRNLGSKMVTSKILATFNFQGVKNVDH